MTNELFPEIDIVNREQTKFKENVYLKVGSDLKTNIGRELHITMASETASLFKLPGKSVGCSSWNREKGFNRDTKELVECNECIYNKGITIEEKGNSVLYKCKKNYALFMEHPESNDKQFVLTNVNFGVYKTFQEYRRSLIIKGLDVNQVITRVTKIDNPPGVRGNVYSFEFVEELNLDITLEEQDFLDTIKSKLPEPMAIADVVDVLKTFAKEMGVTIEDARARRLVETIATDGEKGRMVYPGK